MPEIKILPIVVQNKIAAGEVIERPASVAKELIENAIDAGADTLIIDSRQGGGQLLRVTDNGCGMNRENLARCIERHATSKINDIDDIFHIHTLGFRGEALPSIGAVARIIIQSGIDDRENGWQLSVNGGEIGELTPCPPRRGTIVEVNDLFFNTPARRKFMKSVAAETSAISETITRLALAYPNIAFRWRNNDQDVLQLRGAQTLSERVRELFGEIKMLPVDFVSDKGLQISGLIAQPPENRAQSRFIYTLLNHRWFRHIGLIRGITDAVAGNLPPRRYPLAVLNFTIDPTRVDVNAHPTKEVIRFDDEHLLISSAYQAVQKALSPPSAKTVFNAPMNYAAINETLTKSSAIKDAVTTYMKNSAPPNFSAPATPKNTLRDYSSATSNFSPRSISENSELILTAPTWNFLGQVGAKYLVVEKTDGLLLIDQHALHERWCYEQLKKNPQTIIRQALLVPIEINLTTTERAIIAELLPILREVGFTAAFSANNDLIISAYPENIARENIASVCREIIADGSTVALEQLRDEVLARLACRSAVLFGKNLPPELSADLLNKYLKNALIVCPHGRPTALTITWEELATRFGR